MKKKYGVTLIVLGLLAFSLLFSGCTNSLSTGWDMEGTFQDDQGNFLYITNPEEKEHEGWFVGCTLGKDSYGWYLEEDGNTLHGNLIPEYEKGEFIVTVSREGDDKVMLETQDGKTYHFTETKIDENPIKITVNVDGTGYIKYAKEGEKIEGEFVDTSAQINLEKPEKYTLAAQPEEGWKFVKWTKGGKDFSKKDKVEVDFSESADYVAVFEVQE